MTQEQYDQALSGLKGVPEKHIVIDGRVHYSLAQLEAARAKSGLTKAPDAPVRVVRKATAATLQAPAKVQDPAVKKAPPASPSGAAPSPAGGGESTVVDGVEIPANLGTVGFNDLKKLASALGIKPVPNTTGELHAAIEAKRSGDDSGAE